MGLLAVTASTGCAACGIKGQTIHAWAGVGTGLGSDLTAEDLFMKLGKQNKRNWAVTRVLLIDEISMISAKDLDKLSELACIARNNRSQPFGGMQVIAPSE
jgi:ATP-dependent DNA helicase PIF1